MIVKLITSVSNTLHCTFEKKKTTHVQVHVYMKMPTCTYYV